MRFSASQLWLAMLSTTTIAFPLSNRNDDATIFGELAQAAYDSEIDSFNSTISNRTSTCSLDKIRTRKEWGSLSGDERIAYTDAVLCLQKLPSITPTSVATGAKSRFDDFVVTHILQTPYIHNSGTFLAWHRWFIWNYEEALRTECNYTGTQPYWNWGMSASDTEKSPVFDGSATSMSGNGAYIPNRGPLTLVLAPNPDIVLPSGNGGGCVTSGPFKDMKVNLGPVARPLNNGSTAANGDGLSYNPRCLVRDIGTAVNARDSNFTSIVNLIRDNQDLVDFQLTMQGTPGTSSLGVHGGGHYTIAGDPGADVYTSPGDPAFYLHHGMIDNVWWIWQNIDIKNRKNVLSGTGTSFNKPPSDNTTLDTMIDIGYARGSPIAMRDLLSVTDGPFCYLYL